MLSTLAVNGYRSLFDMVMPLSPLTVITGENGSGKSNLYRALRLLADVASGDVVSALAQQGGLPSTLWAGPEKISRAMERGEAPVQGSPRQKPVRLRLGFASSDFGYLIELGLPTPAETAFNLDPEIKRECVWNGPVWRPASSLVERHGPVVKRRDARQWHVVASHLTPFDSLFTQAGDPNTVPEVFALQRAIQNWRFYADFRTDPDAPARQSRPATRTPVLHHDGRDLAAALQTIREIGNVEALDQAIDDAFPGTVLGIDAPSDGQLRVTLRQPGLLRPLQCSEWSDGTLRYVLLVAALLTPRPPSMMVLNEPETSLHPDLLPALARLIQQVSKVTQVWVVSHAQRLVNSLDGEANGNCMALHKNLGRTQIIGLCELDKTSMALARNIAKTVFVLLRRIAGLCNEK